MAEGFAGVALRSLAALAFLLLCLLVAHRQFLSFMAQRPGNYAETGPPSTCGRRLADR